MWQRLERGAGVEIDTRGRLRGERRALLDQGQRVVRLELTVAQAYRGVVEAEAKLREGVGHITKGSDRQGGESRALFTSASARAFWARGTLSMFHFAKTFKVSVASR